MSQPPPELKRATLQDRILWTMQNKAQIVADMIAAAQTSPAAARDDAAPPPGQTVPPAPFRFLPKDQP